MLVVLVVATENVFFSVGFSILNGTKAHDELEGEFVVATKTL